MATKKAVLSLVPVPTVPGQSFNLDRVVSENEAAAIIGCSKDTCAVNFAPAEHPARATVRPAHRLPVVRDLPVSRAAHRAAGRSRRWLVLAYAGSCVNQSALPSLPALLSMAALQSLRGTNMVNDATMQRRERLSNRRPGETFELEVGGLKYTARSADAPMVGSAKFF